MERPLTLLGLLPEAARELVSGAQVVPIRPQSGDPCV
jgi:hypothetical protein